MKNHRPQILLKLLVLNALCFFTSSAVQAQEQLSKSAREMRDHGLVAGIKLAPELSVYDPDKVKVKLSSVFKKKYTVVTLGCLTCPGFHRSYQGVEAVYADYKDNEDVDFYYLYKRLAHPENHGYVDAYTLEERFAHIQEAIATLNTKVPWLAAPMTDEIETAFKRVPNPNIIFDSDGTVVHISKWSDGEMLREVLAGLVGPVENPTTVADLPDMPEIRIINKKSDGVVPRMAFSETLIPLVLEPQLEGRPFFVKLQAEANGALLQTGNGQLYLGFNLDPIHHVHWNNLAAPLKYTLVNSSVTFSPVSASAPEVKSHASDKDPREFLVDVQGWGANEAVEIKVDYYACDDQDRWCYPVSERFTISLARSPHYGGAIDRSFERPKSPPVN